jgi:dephospho-CoA kinase
MLKVGLTGGIGSGKSTVCKIFKCLNIPVFDADAVGRHLLDEDPVIKEQVQNIFGKQFFIDGKPDRKGIAKIAFTNPDKLARLNSLIHPEVRRRFNEWASEQNGPYVIDEAAILFETGFYLQLDYIILVTAPESLRIKRIMDRDLIEEDAIRARMKNQWSDGEKKRVSSFVIVNDETSPLIPQVIDIHNKLIATGK